MLAEPLPDSTEGLLMTTPTNTRSQGGADTRKALIHALDRYLRQDETAGDTDNNVYRDGLKAMADALAVPASAQEALTEAEKHKINPYKYSRGAASIWRNGFDAAERIYAPGDTDAVEKTFGIAALASAQPKTGVA